MDRQGFLNGGNHEPSIHEDVAYIVRKIFRGEHIDTDRVTERQREYIRNGLYVLATMQPHLKTLDQQLAFHREEIREYAGFMSYGRTLFRTGKSMFGAGHLAIRAGDIVTLVAGVRSPIILRPRAVCDGGGFTFVGDAYVDGIMQGEYLKTMPAFEEFEIF